MTKPLRQRRSVSTTSAARDVMAEVRRITEMSPQEWQGIIDEQQAQERAKKLPIPVVFPVNE